VNKLRGSLAVKRISLALLLTCLCLGNLNIEDIHAQGLLLKTDKVSPELRELARGARQNDRVTVIIQLGDAPDKAFDTLISINGGRVKHRFQAFNSISVELPARAVEALAASNNVRFITPDR
jgi:hypothetical protein